jgi:hypothetical protein
MSDEILCKGIGSQEELWVLSADRRSLRLQLPLLPIDGRAEPIKVGVEFDTGAVDQILKRLLELRTQLLPPPERN